MSDHPSRERLRRLLEASEQLPDAEYQTLEQHLETCAACRDLFERLLGAGDMEKWRQQLAAAAPPAAAEGEGPPTKPEPKTEPDLFPFPPSTLPGYLGQLGHYHIVKRLGVGAMGAVFLADDVRIHRRVALKVPRPDLGESAAFLQQFESEVRAAAVVQHEHVVTTHDLGSTPGFPLPYLIMEYIEGETLSERLKQRKVLPPREAADIARQVALGLAAAHEKGVIHRDIKPSNILLERGSGRVKITDFGLAKRLDVEGMRTHSGEIKGTPSYMAPEQAQGRTRAIGPAADGYAVGVVLYEMLTGRPPFLGANLMDTLQQVINEEPLPPRRLQPTLPRDLETICLKALAKTPGSRYATACGMAEDLRRYLKGEPIQARPVGRVEKAWRWCRRNPMVAGLVAAVATLLVAVAGGATIAAVWFDRVAEDAKCAHNSAVEALGREETEHRAAEDARTKEHAERRRADASAENNRQNLYAARVSLAQQAWERGDLGRVLELLDSLRPQPGQEDLRGFEWYHLWRLCHGGRLTLRHKGPVKAMAFAPDGKALATAAESRPAKLWDLATGQEQITLKETLGGVLSIAFAPDGQKLATGSTTGAVKVWDRHTGEQLMAFPGHTDAVGCLAFSPDGKLLAAASGYWSIKDGNPLTRFLPASNKGGQVKLWDLATGKQIAAWQAHSGGVLSMAFHPDGKRLATAGADPVVKLWSVPEGQQRAAFSGHGSSVFCVAFSPDGKTLATGGWDRTARLWDLDTSQERISLDGHREAVLSLAFAPDGKTLATGSFDQTVKLWNTTTGKEQNRIHGHAGAVTCLAFSPVNQTLATGSWDGTVKLWDPARRMECDVLQPSKVGTDSGSYSVAFSPDGKLLASAGRTINLWDATIGEEIRTLDGYTNGDISVAFSPDGKTLAAAGTDCKVTLWDVSTWQVRATFRGHKTKIWCLAFSSDGKILATGDGSPGEIKLWEVATGEEIATLSPGSLTVRTMAFFPNGTLATGGSKVLLWDLSTRCVQSTLQGDFHVACSPDGKTLAVQRGDGRVRKLVDAATGEERATLKGHMDDIYQMSFSPDGKRLATASWDGTVKLWHVGTGQELLTFRGPGGVAWCAAFAPDGRTLAIGSGKYPDGRVTLWRAAAEEELKREEKEAPPASSLLPEHPDHVLTVALSPDGRWLASGGGDPWTRNRPEAVRIWDMTVGKEWGLLEGHGGAIRQVTFSPDGTRLATASADRTVKVWNVGSRRELFTLTGHSAPPKCVAFSPDGRWLVAGAGIFHPRADQLAAEYLEKSYISGKIKVWDAAQGTEVAVFRAHRSRVNALAFSPDGAWLATASLDHTVKIWNAKTWKEKQTLAGHTGMVLGVAFSPDGHRLATCSSDRTVRVWDADTGRVLHLLLGHTRNVNCVTFSPDGTRLFTGSYDRTVKEWDLSAGDEDRTLEGHTHSVNSLAVSADGKRLVTGSLDRTVRVWEIGFGR
jgi:WD40 repeat protein